MVIKTIYNKGAGEKEKRRPCRNNHGRRKPFERDYRDI